MLRPFLLVGIGGSGGKTLRTARADLMRRLQSVGWEEKFPAAWQFVHVDVPVVADGMDPDLPGALPNDCYTGLVAPGVSYRLVDSSLTSALNKELNLEATAGWRPDPIKVNIPIEKGAGQFRAIGRMITVTHLGDIVTGVRDALAKLNGPEVAGQLMRVADKLGADSEGAVPPPQILVLSSIAGGSGAGAVIDVTWALRAAGISSDQVIQVLYAPDVFDKIPEQQRKGVRPNALATLSELCAAYWNLDGLSRETSALYSAEGIAATQSDGDVPRMILVGRKNSTVDFVQQNSVYTAMGRALGAWMADAHVQDQANALFIGNDQNALPTSVDFPSLLPEQKPPFRAIGFARVSMGRDVFREYVTQFLARQGVDFALRKHEDFRTGPEDDRKDRELIEESAKINFRGFLVQSGLDERGKEHNDVLDAIAPENRKALYDELSVTIDNAISGAFTGKGGVLDPNSIRTRIVRAANDNTYDYLGQERSGQLAKAQDWVNLIQRRVMAAVAMYVSAAGAPATAEMARMMTEEELPYIIEELRGEADEFRGWSADLDGVVQGQLAAAGTASIRHENPNVAAAVNAAAECLYYRAEESQRLLAMELLRDLKENFLEPLTRALTGASQLLVADEQPQGAVQSEVMMWPRGMEVPKRLEPASNEFLLDDVSTFPKTARSLVKRSVAGDLSEGDALATAVREVLTGTDEVGGLDQNLVAAQRTWVSKVDGVRRASDAPQRATFSTALRAEQILARSEAWCLDKTRAMGKYLAEPLSKYLANDSAEPEELTRRLRMFEGQLVAAMAAADPLASINVSMLERVHGQNRTSASLIFSVVPFSGEKVAQAREVFNRVLQNNTHHQIFEIGDSEIASAIDIFAFLDQALQAVAFDSVMAPIAEEWNGSKFDPNKRGLFWRWRRARPLPEFIPLAPALRRAMVRGWFTASLLGQLQVESVPVRIFDPKSRDWVDFPEHLLQHMEKPYEVLPVILKSLPLAWAACATQKNLKPMAAYRRLAELGGTGELNLPEDYQANTTLTQWLRSGRPGDKAPTPALTGDDVKARCAAFVDRLDKWEKSYSKVFEEARYANDPIRTPRAFEMRHDILAALEDIRSAVLGVDDFVDDDFN